MIIRLNLFKACPFGNPRTFRVNPAHEVTERRAEKLGTTGFGHLIIEGLVAHLSLP
jgi:hypothetical protein